MAYQTAINTDDDLLVSFVDLDPQPEDFLTAVVEGLSADQKSLPV